MAGITLRSSDFKAVVSPILNKVYDGVYKQRTNEYTKLFADETGIPRSYHEEPLLYGFGMAPQLPDGQPITYDQGGVLYSARGYYQVYGLAFAMTKVLVEDGDHIRLGKIYAQHLAQAMNETEETVPVNILNRAFNPSYVGGDNSALCVNNHIAAPGAVAAAGDPSRSNLLTTSAALSQTSLEQMLIQVRGAKDPRGKNIRLNIKQLVVSPSNMLQAEVLVKSVLRAGTNNNDLNPVNSMGAVGEVVVLSRLTSTTAWFAHTDAQQGLQMLWRRRLEKATEGDFETDSVRYKATMRFVPMWVDWRTLYGTPGT